MQHFPKCVPSILVLSDSPGRRVPWSDNWGTLRTAFLKSFTVHRSVLGARTGLTKNTTNAFIPSWPYGHWEVNFGKH